MVKHITFILLLLLVSAANAQVKKYNKTGTASFYANKFKGRKTANGETYSHSKKTAAHRTLPFGSKVRVTNLENNRSVVVRINDRGPFVANRIIDLSKSAAKELDFIEAGLAKVRVELISSSGSSTSYSNDSNNHKYTEITDEVQSKPKGVYFKVIAKTAQPKGKGIQIGCYIEQVNVLQMVEQIRNRVNDNIYVEVAKVNDQKIYRVIVGSYTNELPLKRLKRRLKDEFPDCFVFSY